MIITITFDTQSKEMRCVAGEQEITDVNYISVSKNYGGVYSASGYSIDICREVIDKEEKTSSYQRFSATENELVANPQNKVVDAIQSYFGANR